MSTMSGTVPVANSTLSSSVVRTEFAAAKSDIEALETLHTKVSSYASLDAAITAAGSTNTDLYINAAISMSGNVTVPSNVKLIFMRGGSVNQSTYTLTINGSIEAGPWQIFTGTGTVTFGAGNREVIPQWWGAVGDDSTDCTTAITAAYTSLASGAEASDSFGGVLLFPKGVYRFSALDFSFPTQNRHLVHIKGQGAGTASLNSGTTVLKCTGSAEAIKLGRAIVSNLRLETSTATHGLYFTAANTDSKVDNVMIDGFSTYGVWWSGFSGSILNSKLRNNATNIYLSANAMLVQGNAIESWTTAGVELVNCTNINIIGNTIETGTGPAIYGTTTQNVGVNVIGNYFEAVTAATTPDGQIRSVAVNSTYWNIIGNYFNLSSKANVYAIYATKMIYTTIKNNRIVNNAETDRYYIDTTGCYNIVLHENNASMPGNRDGIFDATYYKSISGPGASYIKYLKGYMMIDDNGAATASTDDPEAKLHIVGQLAGDGGTAVDTSIILQNELGGTNPGCQIKGLTGAVGSGTLTGAIKFYKGTSANYGKLAITVNKNTTETTIFGSTDGADASVGDGAWNGVPLKLGAYYLWVDSTGDLRIKSGAPANDTDGTIVGTQS